MSEVFKYPHLEQLERVREVLDAPLVWVTEKIDGFNARFGQRADGSIWVGSRNLEVDPEKETLQGFVPFALNVVPRLLPGETVIGEWCGQGINGRIPYGEKHFLMFDLRRDGVPAMPAEVMWRAADLGLELVPTVMIGRPPSIEDLDAERRKPSEAAPGSAREGIVIRPWPPVYAHGREIIAKFRNPAFAETASQREDRPPRDLTDVQAFVDEYVTEERLRHVIAHLSETEPLDATDARNIGPILRELYADITREGADDFAKLYSDQKMVGGVAAKKAKAILVEKFGLAL